MRVGTGGKPFNYGSSMSQRRKFRNPSGKMNFFAISISRYSITGLGERFAE